jgi:hypothetical protein
MDKVTIALSCRDEFGWSRNRRTHYRDNSHDFIIAAWRGKEPESRAYENESSIFAPYSRARLPFGFTGTASRQLATGWRLARRQHRGGQNALLSLTAGTYNTAVGWFSLQSNLTGNLNTAIGVGTLLENTADNNTAGGGNTAIGSSALFNNITGDSKHCSGHFGRLGRYDGH